MEKLFNPNLLYWWKQKDVWRNDLTLIQKYRACKHFAQFECLAKQFPLSIVQKRKGV